MTTTRNQDDWLECFILLFLPEGKTEQKGTNELRLIENILAGVLQAVGMQTSIDDLFAAFQNLSYSIAVVEPREEGLHLGPYEATNSHAIHIGVDGKSLLRLKTTAKLIGEGKISQSQDYAALYKELVNFAAQES